MVAVACATAASPQIGGVAGERAYQKCYSCHALEPGKNDLTGPSLHGIIGRSIASQPGFDYSSALRQFAKRHPRWSPGLLDRLVADPQRLVPGTSMAFHGMTDAQERAALIQYLRTLTSREASTARSQD